MASTKIEDSLVASYNDSQLAALKDIKSGALEEFKSNGLPPHKTEEYKFTHFSKALEKNFSTVQTTAEKLTVDDIQSRIIDPSASVNLIFVNGQFLADLSKIEDLPSGLILKDLEQALQDNEEEVKKHFGQYADYKVDGFTALNTALASNGVFLSLDKNVVFDSPIYIYYFNDGRNNEGYSFPRNLVVAKSGSQVTFIEKAITVGEQNSFFNPLSEIVVEPNAHVHHVKIQNDGSNSYEVCQTQVQQSSDSTYSSYVISLDGAMIRNNLNIVSNGQNCESNMYGLYLLDGETHVDNHTTVDHKEPNSNSNELYKGIMDDKSRGVFNGKIYVRQEAQKTNAFQSNNNILLSDNATINTKPQLEIWADDVKCSHGCTTGQLDEEAVFYLQARGIDKVKAKAMLLYAFAHDIVEKIPVEIIRDRLDNFIFERLEN